MSMEDVILVATVWEEICGSVLRVNVTDILHYVTKTEAGAKLANLMAEMKAKADVEATTKAGAETNAKYAEAEAKAEASAREKHEADANTKAETKSQEKVEAEAREKWEAEAKSDVKDAEIAGDAKTKVAMEAKAAAVKAGLEVKQKAEEERLGLEPNFKAEAARAKEEWKKCEAEKAALCAKQVEEQIARAVEKDARAAASTSVSNATNSPWSRSSWLRKTATASAIIPLEELTSPWV